MIIILGTITYTSLDNFKLDQYYKMCADIELLDGKVTLYYLEHKNDEAINFGLPIDDNKVRASSELETIVTTEENVNYNPNNCGELYKIDFDKLDNLTLNHTGDFFVDKQSHTVYYSTGYEIDGDTYYTIPKEYKVSDANVIKTSLYCMIEFYSNNGTENLFQKIKNGEKAQKPKNPKNENFEFRGWYYLENEGTEEEPDYVEKEFNFNEPVIHDYELYAKYVGEAVMMTRNDNYAFWQESIRTNLKKITFTKNTLLIPESPMQTWDIREDTTNGGLITAYLKDSENLIIYSPYNIYANPNASNYFMKFSSLATIEFDNFDTSKVKTMACMFDKSNSLTNLNLSQFNTSNVTSMTYMFNGCTGLTSLNLSNFNTGKVRNMYCMFYDCSGLTSLNLSNFNTSQVTIMQSMFNGCNGLTNLNVSSFDTSKVVNMLGMFNGCSKLTSLDLSNFNTNQVTKMSYMFNECAGLTSLNVSSFNTSQVTTM